MKKEVRMVPLAPIIQSRIFLIYARKKKPSPAAKGFLQCALSRKTVDF